MVGPKQQLQGHAFAEKPGGNVGGGDAAGDIGVLVGVVEAGQHDRVRQLLLMIAQILLYKVGHIIADAHKGGGPLREAVQIGIDLLLIRKDAHAVDAAVFRADGQLISVHAFAVTQIPFFVGLRIVDVADEADLLMAVQDQRFGDLGLGAVAFDQQQIAVQLSVCQGRNGVQKDLRQRKVVDHPQYDGIVYVYHGDAGQGTAKEDGRQHEVPGKSGRHIRLTEES